MSMVGGVTELGAAARLDRAPYWVDGGPLQRWAVVYSRLAHPLGAGDQKARFMFTKVGPASAIPVIQRWMDQLNLLGIATEPDSGQMFWRIAVRQRALALNAQVFRELSEAVDGARQVTRRAAALTVSFGFFPGDPIPKWVVRDEDIPVFVGLPQHHLVRVSDPQASLAALIAGAQIKTKVHEVVAPSGRGAA